MDDAILKQVTQLWEAGANWRDLMAASDAHALVAQVIGALDRGEVRIADVVDERVVVNEAAKHAVLMWFRVNEMSVTETGPFEYVDKLPLKHGYLDAGVRGAAGGGGGTAAAGRGRAAAAGGMEIGGAEGGATCGAGRAAAAAAGVTVPGRRKAASWMEPR